MIGEEILFEIDETLDRLIQNAEAIENVDITDLSETEVNAFQNTQESLLQHFLHMDELLKQKKDSLRKPTKDSANFKIQQKLTQFQKMESSYTKHINDARQKTPFFSKRKRKRFLISAY